MSGRRARIARPDGKDIDDAERAQCRLEEGGSETSFSLENTAAFHLMQIKTVKHRRRYKTHVQ